METNSLNETNVLNLIIYDLTCCKYVLMMD